MGDSARFTQKNLIVPLTLNNGGDYNAGGDLDSVNMALYKHATIIIVGDASIAGNGVLTLYGGATDGAKTAAVTFTYRYSQGDVAAASSDVLGTPATSAALTITGTSLESRMLVIEVDTEDMVVSGTQYQYLTASLSNAGTGGNFTAIAILSEPRYKKSVMPTAVPTS